MSLFVDTTGGDPTQDLEDISWCDGALGQGSASTIHITGGVTPGDYAVTQVTYSGAGATTGMATADRLFTLVNTSSGANWAFPILVMPLVGGFSPFSGHPMTANGETGIIGGTPNPVIVVVYDISNGGGAGIQGFDTGGNPISTPRNVVLYHELSHAFHGALNQIPFPQSACPGDTTTDEPAAEIDENVMRSQLGLCLRDVCNHGGGAGSGSFCGGRSRPACTGASSGGGSGSSSGCFIVSATTGSPESDEVIALRKLRDRVASLSPLSARLIDGIYSQYARFSPSIAAELKDDSLAKFAALAVAVRPLIAWYSLAATLALDSTDPVKVSHAAQKLVDACPRSLGTSILPIMEAIRTEKALPENTPELLFPFVPRVREAAQLPLAAWAILDPLIRAWSITTNHLDAVGQVFEWLASAPLETFPCPCECGALDRELAALARFFDLQPAAGRQLGNRLAMAWPKATEALKRHGLV